MNDRQHVVPFKKSPRIHRLAIVVLAIAWANTVSAQTPTDTVRSTVDSVLAVLQQGTLSEQTKRRNVKRLIAQRFDFRAMASRVLATNWKNASMPQRSKFTSLFRELLTNTYWRKISRYERESVEYTGEKIRNNKLATVNTVIRTSTVNIPVDYKLYRKADQNWYVYDVVIEQVSLVRNYRGSFQQIVHDVGIDGLIAQLETKGAQSSVPLE